MDGDKIEGELKQESGDPLPYNSNFFQPFGFRRFVRSYDEVDRVLLDYGYIFYCLSGFFFGLYYLFHRKTKKEGY